MADRTTLAIRSLDLTARVVDLTTSLGQASALANGLIEIGQWLALERVNRQELYSCFTKANGVAYANPAGAQFYDEVLSGPPMRRVWPLAIQQSGALGRIMIKDPHLAWIVSTTACLLQFHNERFVSEAVCMMIMQSQPETQGKPEYELRYLASRIELKAVIDRIITSVWFNVVNSGKDTMLLPAELRDVCSKGHHLNGDKFGLVTHKLKEVQDKVVVESKHLLGNLTLWLLLHFHGSITVTVSGKVIFKNSLGDSAREIELKVKVFCSEDHDCSDEEDTYRLYTDIRGSFEEFLSGTYPSSFDMPATSKTRKALYDVHKAYDIGTDILNSSTMTAARAAAKLLARWLMAVPLVPPVDADFSFSISDLELVSKQSNRSPLTIGDILGRSPAILNLLQGEALSKSKIYANPERQSDVDDHDDESMEGANKPHRKGSETADFEDEDVIAYFPTMQDLVIIAKGNCQCNDCETSRHFGNDDASGVPLGYTIPSGCLSQAATTFVFLLIGHALADAFGAPDVSGTRDPAPIMKGILTVFSEMLRRKQIRWDSWFNLAACVYLGCPFKEYVMDIELGGTAYAAIQYGNLAVIAPWLDFSTDLTVNGCFSFVLAEGKVGVLRADGEGSQFRGIQEQFAIVQTEHTEDTSSYGQRFEKVTESLSSPMHLAKDDSELKQEVMLVQADVDVYRILIRVQSDTVRRLVDPVDGMIRLVRGLPYVECPHREKYQQLKDVRNDIKVYTFDELLSRWQSEETFYGINEIGPPIPFHGKKKEDNAPGLTYHLSTILDGHTKSNVARALVVSDLAIVNMGRCCITCALEKARTIPVPDELDGDDIRDRYIINIEKPGKNVITRPKRRFDQIED